MERISKEVAKSQFIVGLKESIKNELKLIQPQNLDHAMELALKIEQKQTTTGKSSTP